MTSAFPYLIRRSISMADPWDRVMEPWWAALYGRDGLMMDSHLYNDHVYNEYMALDVDICLDPSPRARKVAQRQFRVFRDALELVAILAHVDRDAWVRGMTQTVQLYSASLCPERGDFPPRVRFNLNQRGLADVSDEQGTISLLQEFIRHVFAPLTFRQRGNAFCHARKLLLTRATTPEMRYICENLEIPVIMSGHFSSTELYRVFQSELEEVYAQQKQMHQLHRCPFVLKAMDISVWRFPLSPLDGIRLGANLARRQVPLRELNVSNESGDPVAIICGAMSSKHLYQDEIFCSEVSPCSYLGTETERIAAFSSIAANRELKTLNYSIDWEEAEVALARKDMLRWVAFASLSPLSGNSVQCLDLSLNNLVEEDADAMAEVINALNPLQVLLGSSEDECKMSALSTDVTIRVEGTPVRLRAGLRVWVVHNRPSEGCMEVLVPGYGVRSIDRRALSVPFKPVPKPPVARVRLSMGAHDGIVDGFPGLVRLLSAIGQHLKDLSVWDHVKSCALRTFDVRTILLLCPSLVDINLNNIQVDNLDAIVDAYEAGVCRVQRLSLEDFTARNADGTDRFLNAMQSNNHVMAKSILELEFSMDSFIHSSNIVSNLITMLERNRTLQVLMIRVRDEDYLRVVRKALRDSLSHSPDVYVQLEPLSLHAKLAFLSITTANPNPVCEAAEQMDSGIHSIIFSFAAPTVRRVVWAIQEDETLDPDRDRDLTYHS